MSPSRDAAHPHGPSTSSTAPGSPRDRACGRCNRERGHRSPSDWLAECRRRGWEPDADAVAGALRSLHRAITSRGGQRRARPYPASQLRRLAADAA